MWFVRDVLYAVLYVRVSCFVVRGCGVSRRYIDVCYCDMFSVVNVYRDHLKFYVVCIMAGMPKKTVNRAHIAGGGEVRHNLHSSLSPL